MMKLVCVLVRPSIASTIAATRGSGGGSDKGHWIYPGSRAPKPPGAYFGGALVPMPFSSPTTPYGCAGTRPVFWMQLCSR